MGTRFTAAGDTLPLPATDDHGVAVEEAGPHRVTIRAVGWYVSGTGDKLCKFVTRLSAYADQPFVRVAHRTLLTYDTRRDRIRDLGWETVSLLQGGTYAFGLEGAPPFSRATGLTIGR